VSFSARAFPPCAASQPSQNWRQRAPSRALRQSEIRNLCLPIRVHLSWRHRCLNACKQASSAQNRRRLRRQPRGRKGCGALRGDSRPNLRPERPSEETRAKNRWVSRRSRSWISGRARAPQPVADHLGNLAGLARSRLRRQAFLSALSIVRGTARSSSCGTAHDSSHGRGQYQVGVPSSLPVDVIPHNRSRPAAPGAVASSDRRAWCL